jgi:hypothetical protein
MQQRQPRLGDILDDYCPRERRLTNHVVVAMIGDAVKQTRCTTCDSDHEYKHAAMPRQRKKSDQSALYSQVLAGVTPKKVALADPSTEPFDPVDHNADALAATSQDSAVAAADGDELLDVAADEDAVLEDDHDAVEEDGPVVEEGPAHRRLIRAQLPRHEGQVSTARQPTDFTIRQPTPPRAKRFGARNQRGPGAGGAQFQGNRPGGGNNGSGNSARNGAPRPGGRPQGGGQARPNRHGGRNRPK